jgi:hypothetical protein
MWMRLRWRQFGGSFSSLKFTWRFEDDIEVSRAEAAWHALIDRHEILRTVFVQGPDNHPVQVVLGSAEIRLPVSVAEFGELAGHRAQPATRLFGDGCVAVPLWHARMFLDGSTVRAVTISAEHLVCDGLGLLNWRQQFLEHCRGTGEQSSITQPLDRLTAERESPRREETRAHHASLAGRAPQILVPAISRHDGDRYLLLHAKYPDLLPQLDALCLEYRCSRTTAGIFVLAFLLSHYARRPDIFIESLYSNRAHGDIGIDCQMLPVWQLLEFDDTKTLGSTVKEIFADSLATYSTGVVDELTALELRALAAGRRGTLAPRPTTFNYVGPSAPARSRPRPDATLAEQPATEKFWSGSGQPFLNLISIWIEEGIVELGLDVDVRMLPEHLADAIASAVPGLVRLMRARPDATLADARATLAIRPAELGGHTMIDRNWISLKAVVELLEQHPAVRSAEAVVSGTELVARVVPATGALSADDLHEYVRSRLNEYTDVMAPHRYEITDVPGTAPDMIARSPTTAEREVGRAFAEIHGGAPPDLGKSYVEAGGELLLAPSVAEVLRRHGHGGLEWWHFDSGSPLRAMARSLTGALDHRTDPH